MTNLQKNIRIFAKISDIFRKYAVKTLFIFIFFSNNLHISKKHSNFAPFSQHMKTDQNI